MGKKVLMYRLRIIVLGILLLSGFSAYGQNVEGLLKLIESGAVDSARVQLEDLSFKNPGNPGLRYARALIESDALVAAGLYRDIIRNHSDSRYVAGSLMHLGEYYYAQGLYVQSRQYFARLIRFHGDYPELINAVNLSLRAGLASRQLDSVYFDLQDILQRYPNLAFDIPEELDLTRLQHPSSHTPPTPELVDHKPLRALGASVSGETTGKQGAYYLQAGAFGNYDNARRLSDQIASIGYEVRIDERVQKGKKLYLIHVGSYPDRTSAMSAVDMLEAALGISAYPVANH